MTASGWFPDKSQRAKTTRRGPKVGNTYLRDPLMVGAIALVRLGKRESTRWRWVAQLLERHKPKAVAVVLANQNARIIWATIATRDALREEEFAAS